jgi:hypothetical protein
LSDLKRECPQTISKKNLNAKKRYGKPLTIPQFTESDQNSERVDLPGRVPERPSFIELSDTTEGGNEK